MTMTMMLNALNNLGLKRACRAHIQSRQLSVLLLPRQSPSSNVTRQSVVASGSLTHYQQRRAYKKSHFLKNLQIPYENVSLEDPTHPDVVSRPQPLTDILASINRDTHFVLLTKENPPTVRIVSRVEDEVRKLEEKQKRKQGGGNSGAAAMAGGGGMAVTNKEVHFKWATDAADYDHKVSKLRDELAKGVGMRVDVVFERKVGVRSPPKPVMDQKLEELRARVEDLGSEWKERRFFGGNAYMFLQSTVQRKKASKEELEELARAKLGARRSKIAE